MNAWTWAPVLPAGLNIFEPGNLIAFEQKAHGGLEMRHNVGVRSLLSLLLNRTVCCLQVSFAYCCTGCTEARADKPCSVTCSAAEVHWPVPLPICSALPCALLRISTMASRTHRSCTQARPSSVLCQAAGIAVRRSLDCSGSFCRVQRPEGCTQWPCIAVQADRRDVLNGPSLRLPQKGNDRFTCSQELQAVWQELHAAASVRLSCTRLCCLGSQPACEALLSSPAVWQ